MEIDVFMNGEGNWYMFSAVSVAVSLHSFVFHMYRLSKSRGRLENLTAKSKKRTLTDHIIRKTDNRRTNIITETTRK